jgi:branched-subunit amino acid ABC-type transport system permease component
VLGGLESVTGVAAGAFVLALLENVTAAYTAVPTSLQDALSFTLLVVTLVVLPQGLPGLSRLMHVRRRG